MKDINQKLTRPLQLRQQKKRKKEGKNYSGFLWLFLLIVLGAITALLMSGPLSGFRQWALEQLQGL